MNSSKIESALTNYGRAHLKAVIEGIREEISQSHEAFLNFPGRNRFPILITHSFEMGMIELLRIVGVYEDTANKEYLPPILKTLYAKCSRNELAVVLLDEAIGALWETKTVRREDIDLLRELRDTLRGAVVDRVSVQIKDLQTVQRELLREKSRRIELEKKYQDFATEDHANTSP